MRQGNALVDAKGYVGYAKATKDTSWLRPGCARGAPGPHPSHGCGAGRARFPQGNAKVPLRLHLGYTRAQRGYALVLPQVAP